MKERTKNAAGDTIDPVQSVYKNSSVPCDYIKEMENLVLIHHCHHRRASGAFYRVVELWFLPWRWYCWLFFRWWGCCLSPLLFLFGSRNGVGNPNIGVEYKLGWYLLLSLGHLCVVILREIGEGFLLDHLALEDKHGPELIGVELMLLAIITEDREAGWAGEDCIRLPGLSSRSVENLFNRGILALVL